ncbi:MAG: GMC family oxidoreductase [Acetobacteraceae bacterium]
MFIDAATIPDGTTLQGDLCIIGAGAAGITLARDLAGSAHRVILLESGPLDFDTDAADLNAGTSVGRHYLDLATCRQRFFGGTTNHWGGWCLPQEPIDFERGWPISRAELDPFYRRAQDVLELGPFDYRLASWGVRADEVPSPFRGPHFVAKMLQNSPPTRFAETYGPELRRADRVTVVLNATVTAFRTDPAEARVEAVGVAGPGGKRLTVEAGAYVLACGGVENARLLLASGTAGLGNGHDRVGRCFMVHLQCPGGTVAVADPYTDFGFYTNVTSNGRDFAPFRRRFVSFVGLSEATMRAQGLPNARVMWDFLFRNDIRTIRAVQGATSWRGDGHRLTDIGAVMADLGGASRFVFRRLFMRAALPVDALELTFTFEPTPNPDSRVRLGEARDALGQRRVELDWQVNPADLVHARTIARLLGAEVGRAGLGRMRTTLEGADWPAAMWGDQHHMGTTMMAKDPVEGVVDRDCRVHGIENLFVAGSSVFPRAGVANPTLTITALALRLAQHLRRRLA